MNCFFKFVKCLAYIVIYCAATIIIAYVILVESIPDDGQCHAMERPLVIHYILASIITGLPLLALKYSKNKKLKKVKK
jgi:hypothetical protein